MNNYKYFTCWLDFEKSEINSFYDLINSKSFSNIEQINKLQIWESNEVILELLNVDSVSEPPFSKYVNLNLDDIQNSRKQYCNSIGIDPYFKLTIFHKNNDILTLKDFKQFLTNSFLKLNIKFIWEE